MSEEPIMEELLEPFQKSGDLKVSSAPGPTDQHFRVAWLIKKNYKIIFDTVFFISL